MSNENALSIGLRPAVYNWSPVSVRSLDNPDSGDAANVYSHRCSVAFSLNGCEVDVRLAMDTAQSRLYPNEFVFGNPCTYADLSPYRQIKVLDLITDSVIRVQVEDRLLFEQLGINLDVLIREFHDANAGRETARPLSEILRDVMALPAEHMGRVLKSKPYRQSEK